MSIKLRLFLLIGTSVLTVLVISLVNYLGNARMEAAMISICSPFTVSSEKS